MYARQTGKLCCKILYVVRDIPVYGIAQVDIIVMFSSSMKIIYDCPPYWKFIR